MGKSERFQGLKVLRKKKEKIRKDKVVWKG
jgi:hypothetical protein